VGEPEGTGSTPQPRHLAAGATLAVIADVVPLIAAGALSIVLARAVGPEANGSFALVNTVLNMIVLITSLGLSAGLTYEVSHRGWSSGHAVHESYRFAALAGAVGAGAGLAFFALTRDSVFSGVDSEVVLVPLLATPAFLAWQFASSIVLGADRYEAYAALQTANALILLLVGGGLALAFHVRGAVIGLAASGVVCAALGAWLGRSRQRRSAGDSSPSQPDSMRRALRFGLQTWVANVLQQVNYRFDLILLGGFATTADVGLYSVAVTLTGLAWVLPHGLQMVLFPRTASLDAAAVEGRLAQDESDQAVLRGTRHSVLLLVPAGVMVGLLIAVVPLIYGSEFNQTVALGFILLPGVLALGVGKVLGSVVAGRGAPRYNLYTSLIVVVISVALYLVLIPSFHEWGAAAASSASYLATTVIAAVFFRRVVGVPLGRALIPTRADLRNYPEAIEALRAHLRLRRTRRRTAQG